MCRIEGGDPHGSWPCETRQVSGRTDGRIVIHAPKWIADDQERDVLLVGILDYRFAVRLDHIPIGQNNLFAIQLFLYTKGFSFVGSPRS